MNERQLKEAAEEAMAELVHWTTIPMCTQDDNGVPVPIPAGSNLERIAALREYLDTGEIDCVWLCTAKQMQTEPDCTWLGPDVEDIDWSGFDDD